MILYHGSNVEVKEPKIIKSDKGRDFGFAFYLTPIKSQAEKMAKRREIQAKLAGDKNHKAVVSVFEWNENKSGKNYIKFETANMEWLELIIKCRGDTSFKHNYDIVEGKIADDNVGETVALCINGFISKQEAIKRLEFQEINSQVAFCNEESLNDLTFIQSYEVK